MQHYVAFNVILLLIKQEIAKKSKLTVSDMSLKEGEIP